MEREKAENGELSQCSECGFLYREKEWVEKCEKWCKEHKSCSLEIAKHAVKKVAEINKV